MPNNLVVGRMKKLREAVLARQKSPTAKINSILRRKAMFARKNPAQIEKHSTELIFAQGTDRIRVNNEETKRRKLKFKYGGEEEATITNVGLTSKFVNTRRAIHTHPLVVLKGKLRQIPSPSLADLIVLLSLNERTSMIAVPSKRGAVQVAGYMVIKKTNKSAPLVNTIKTRQKEFMNEATQNIENPLYWTKLLSLFHEEKYSLINKDTKLVKSFNAIREKSIALNQLTQIQESQQTKSTQDARVLRDRYEHGAIGQIEYSEKLNALKIKTQEKKIGDIIHLEREIFTILESERIEIAIFQAYQTLLEKGFVEEFRKNSIKNPTLENAGFQRVRPTQPIDSKLLKSIGERKKLIEDKLGLHLRLVPAKGFELKNGQFAKK